MAYTLDAAVEVIKMVDRPFQGHSGIFPFQRDGLLYLVGKNSVAVVDTGIPCSYPNLSNHDETLDSYVEDPFRGKSSLVNEHGRITDESEEKYFSIFCRDPDGDASSLQGLIEIGKKAREKLPNDGKIRMIDHGTRYHSHKHGYAADGVDVSVIDARVMMMREYFDLMRMQETRAKENVGRKNHEGYTISPLPGVAVITPYGLVSFPFSSKLEGGRFARHWGDGSPMINEDAVSFNRKFSPSEEFPHSFNVLSFHGNSRFSSSQEFSEEYGNILAMLERFKDCYTPLVQSVIDEANSLHNSKNASEIKAWKHLHEKKEKIA